MTQAIQSSLADRVEALEGPCRKMDAEILIAVCGYKRDASGDCLIEPNSTRRVFGWPSPTASIDAAMTLVSREKLTDVFNAAWRRLANKYGLHCNHWPEGVSFQHEFAISIAAAALRAASPNTQENENG